MTTTEQIPKWGALGYEPVRGLINRHIARYLRGQRKNMRRFFAERGFSILALRLDEIRKDPAMGMMEKNRLFQEVLNDYAKAVAQPGSTAPVAVPAPEAGDQQATGSAAVDVPAPVELSERHPDDGGPRADAGAGVPVVGEEDGGAD
jgi:hypothetical protein